MSCEKTASPTFFLAGLGTGIALALLFAPLSGVGTRNLIVRKVKEGEDWVKDQAGSVRDGVVSKANGLGDRVKGAAEVLVGS